MPLVSRPASLIACIALTASTLVTSAQAKESDSKPTTVRLLCVAPDMPSKFIRQPGGGYMPIPFSFDECPPISVSMKQHGDTYTPVPFNSVGISPAINLSDQKGHPSGFYFQAFEGGDPLATLGHDKPPERGTPPPATGKAAAGTGGKNAPATPAWHLLADSPKSDGKDHLICLFNPNTKAKWYPAKTLDLDISPAAFPPGCALAINLSAKVVLIQFGEGTKPMIVQPGTTFAVPAPSPSAAGEIALKVAAVIPTIGPRVVYNRSQTIPTDKRIIIALYEAAPIASIPVEVRQFTLDNPKPETDAPPTKTASR